MDENTKEKFLFTKENYLLMIGGLVVIIIGFLLMMGGNPPDSPEFIPEEVYSTRRITVAPIVVLLGFVIEIFAIMRKPK